MIANPQVAGLRGRALRPQVAKPEHRARCLAAVIDGFLARQVGGKAPATPVNAKLEKESNRQVSRLVKAIPTAEMCLTCHARNQIKPEAVNQLAKPYLGDQARGGHTGGMRGVFTLSSQLD